MSNECHGHGITETSFLPIGIHEESPLEFDQEDKLIKHGNYIPSNPCLYEKSPLSIGLSSIATNEIFNPIISPAHKNFERVVVDAYVYHADLVVRILRVGDWRGNHFTNLKHNSKVSQGRAFFPKTSTFRR